jgi:hypothetical protein
MPFERGNLGDLGLGERRPELRHDAGDLFAGIAINRSDLGSISLRTERNPLDLSFTASEGRRDTMESRCRCALSVTAVAYRTASDKDLPTRLQIRRQLWPGSALSAGNQARRKHCGSQDRLHVKGSTAVVLMFVRNTYTP